MLTRPRQCSGTYAFGDVVVDVGAHTLRCGSQARVLEPKAFAVLLELLNHAGSVVTRDELLDRVWGHRAVTPNVLSREITQIRHAIGDCAHTPLYIETVPTLGYRFIAPVQHHNGGAASHVDPEFFSLSRDPAYSMALLGELNRLMSDLNGQKEQYPALSHHVRMLVEVFGNKPSGMVLYELVLAYGLRNIDKLELDLPWRHANYGMADGQGDGAPSSGASR
ncbi:MAG: winged helix-turn-helix domain-containing protein [Arenimonas sp.]